ncbi:MAG: hypothetical protein NTZ65_04635 [Candidatus Berkelbacteria bacterium]|nr:hypothetical protein [Candidatus Berkelbacteria bacterium]
MRKFFSILFLIGFIVFFPVSLFSFNLKHAVLTPTFFKETFRKIDFYKRITAIDPQKIVDYVKDKQGEAQLGISAKQIGTALSYISPDDLQYTFEKNLDLSLNSASKGQSDFPIDLTAIKKSIANKSSDAQTKELLSQIPDSYTPTQTNQTAKRFFSYLPIGKVISYAGPIFVAICLILSFLLWPGWKGKLRLVGTVLLIYGVTILIANLVISQRLAVPSHIVADFLDGILKDILTAIKTKILLVYFYEGLILTITGFVFWLISFFIKTESSQKTLQNPPTTPRTISTTENVTKPKNA